MRGRLEARKRSRGFVLAEFAMTCGIGAMVLSVLPAFYMASTGVFGRETSELGAREQAEMTIHRVKKELRNSRSTTVSTDGRTLTLVLPEVSGEAASEESTTVFNSQGGLVDGDRVRYYYQSESGSSGGSIYRDVTHSDGSTETPKLVAEHVYPQLNPIGSGATKPIFSYDGAKRTVTVTVTAGEPKPSTASFAATSTDPKCSRHGTALVRVATASHSEGVVMCSQCQSAGDATCQLATYQATLLLRNR